MGLPAKASTQEREPVTTEADEARVAVHFLVWINHGLHHWFIVTLRPNHYICKKNSLNCRHQGQARTETEGIAVSAVDYRRWRSVRDLGTLASK